MDDHQKTDQEVKDLLEETLEVEKENHKILQKMYRSMLWGRVMRIVYFVIVVGATVGAFYALQPYVDTLQEAYGNMQGIFKSGLPGLPFAR